MPRGLYSTNNLLSLSTNIILKHFPRKEKTLPCKMLVKTHTVTSLDSNSVQPKSGLVVFKIALLQFLRSLVRPKWRAASCIMLQSDTLMAVCAEQKCVLKNKYPNNLFAECQTRSLLNLNVIFHWPVSSFHHLFSLSRSPVSFSFCFCLQWLLWQQGICVFWPDRNSFIRAVCSASINQSGTNNRPAEDDLLMAYFTI